MKMGCKYFISAIVTIIVLYMLFNLPVVRCSCSVNPNQEEQPFTLHGIKQFSTIYNNLDNILKIIMRDFCASLNELFKNVYISKENAIKFLDFFYEFFECSPSIKIFLFSNFYTKNNLFKEL